MLEQFEKSSLRLIKRLGLGAQAEASLVRVPNYPFEVVAKLAIDIESFYEISGEIDSLMRESQELQTRKNYISDSISSACFTHLRLCG